MVGQLGCLYAMWYTRIARCLIQFGISLPLLGCIDKPIPIAPPTTVDTPPSASPQPPTQPIVVLEPNTPCIGNQITIRGGNFEGDVATVWLDAFHSGKPPGPPTGPSSNAIQLGSFPISQEGDLVFSFYLQETMSPTRSGGSLHLVPGKVYQLWIEYHYPPGQTTPGRYLFSTCSIEQ